MRKNIRGSGSSTPPPSAEYVRSKTSERGWFQEPLIQIEGAMWGRWLYWIDALAHRRLRPLPEGSIPQVPFANLESGIASESVLFERFGESLMPGTMARSHVVGTFRDGLDHGHNQFRDLIAWWLWAFGSQRIESRPDLSDRGEVAMYHQLQLQQMLAFPGDWGSVLVRECVSERYGKGSAWFPTPIEITRLMVEMVDHDGDLRDKTFHEPCCGTGVMLLLMSNKSLRLSGCDIDWLMCAITEFMAWLFMPWVVWSGECVIFAREDEALPGPEAGPQPLAATEEKFETQLMMF